MSITEKLISDRKKLEAEISRLMEIIQNSPPGYLHIRQRYNWAAEYYHHNPDADGGYAVKYLPRKDRALAEALVKKEYYKCRIEEMIAEKNAIDEYLKLKLKVPKSQTFLNKNPDAKNIMQTEHMPADPSFREWMNSPYPRKNDRMENLIYPTVLPDLNVRSKAEADIAARLVHFKIPFHYEEIAIVNNIQIALDFKCISLNTGKFIYWEHQGRWDDDEYVKNNVFRRDPLLYAAGLVPWKNLIITTETLGSPLDIRWVDKIIEHFLL